MKNHDSNYIILNMNEYEERFELLKELSLQDMKKKIKSMNKRIIRKKVVWMVSI